MAFLEFNGYRKLRTIENGKYSDSGTRMNRREAELYCIAHGLRFAGFEWHWQVYVGVRGNKMTMWINLKGFRYGKDFLS